MTNDDLKRFYQTNAKPEQNIDFVRYDKSGKIQSANPTEASDVVTLQYLQQHGGVSGDPITAFTYILPENVSANYDDTNGILISGSGQYDDGTVHDITAGLVLPIFAGNNIEFNTTDNKITINATASGDLEVQDASTTQKGIIQIATDDDIAAGTNETKAVTPKQLKNVTASIEDQIGNISIVLSSVVTVSEV